MKVELLNNMYGRAEEITPRWFQIKQLIPSNIPNNMIDFAQCHTATYAKIAFASYHYHILNQLYKPNKTRREQDTKEWARAEMHSIIFNLYSALDSLANEINLVYKFGIKENNINIHHSHRNFTAHCFRCALNKVNDSLTVLFNQELSHSWFETFRKLRHQITHKNVPIINITIVVRRHDIHLMIPDDPTNMHPRWSPNLGIDDFSQKLEINAYCSDRITDVIKFAESTYQILESPMQQAFSS